MSGDVRCDVKRALMQRYCRGDESRINSGQVSPLATGAAAAGGAEDCCDLKAVTPKDDPPHEDSRKAILYVFQCRSLSASWARRHQAPSVRRMQGCLWLPPGSLRVRYHTCLPLSWITVDLEWANWIAWKGLSHATHMLQKSFYASELYPHRCERLSAIALLLDPLAWTRLLAVIETRQGHLPDCSIIFSSFSPSQLSPRLPNRRPRHRPLPPPGSSSPHPR